MSQSIQREMLSQIATRKDWISVWCFLANISKVVANVKKEMRESLIADRFPPRMHTPFANRILPTRFTRNAKRLTVLFIREGCRTLWSLRSSRHVPELQHCHPCLPFEEPLSDVFPTSELPAYVHAWEIGPS